jgi:hypothetical protein
MGDFYSYLSVFLSQWWWFLTSGPYVLDPLLESMCESYRWWKMRHFSQTKWHRLKIALVFGGIFFAGFFAWKDEHIQVAQKQTEIDRMDRMGGGGKEAQAKIDSLTQTNQQLQQKVEALGQALEREVAPWGLTDDQKKKLADALNKVPPGVTYKLNIHVIPNCSRCSIYMTELGEVWEKVPGWQIQGGPHFGLDPRLVGVLVPVDIKNCPDEELQLVISALGVVGIKPERVRAEGKLGSECLLLVGSRPRQ